jgi:hypothetical protein
MEVLDRNDAPFRLLAAALTLTLGAALGGCGKGSVDLAQLGDSAAGPSRGVALSVDTDRDGITDSVERRFGTDSAQIDSDGDGLTDQYELWGYRGIGIGASGPLTDLPDPNANGVHAALDRGEQADRTLSAKAVRGLDDTRVRVSAPGDDPLENDLDGDYIPTDFELAGFYYEIDPATGEDWFVKWDGDTSRNYYKTDPTKWSTDADPWSDWEEATKRNLDQRLKHPGDHPCIPAYPDLQAVLTGYTVEEAKDIRTSTGKNVETSWTNSVSTTSSTESNWAVDGSVEVEATVGTTLGAKVKVEAGYTTGGKSSYESVTKQDNSGLTSDEWKQVTAGDTIQTAKLTLNMKLINVGTMPASEANALFNLKLGDFLIDSFLVNLTSINGFGELKGRAQNPYDIIIRNNGRGTEGLPPPELYLSLPQLQSLQRGAPLTIEPVGFEAQTLVSEWDPDTGRRVNLNIGAWSPYKSAINTATARIILDLGTDPEGSAELFDGMSPRRVEEVRVFAYDNTGSYVGSPPAVTLRDAFIWGFGARDTTLGPTVTYIDPISDQPLTAFLEDYNFGFDIETFQELQANQQNIDNILDLPLKPSNPVERVYIAKAPPLVDPSQSIDERKPRVLWATLDPYQQERVPVMRQLRIVGTDPPDFVDPPIFVFDHYDYKPVFGPIVRAYVDDVFRVREVRFKPTPTSFGEAMTVNFDPDNPLAGAAYEYHVPENYVWTGFETIVAINRDNEFSDPLPIFLQEGSFYDNQRNLRLGRTDPTFTVKGRATNTLASATQLLDSKANFLVDGVRAGDFVVNTTEHTVALIDKVISPTQLLLLQAAWVDETGHSGGAKEIAPNDEYTIDPSIDKYEALGFYTGVLGEALTLSSEFDATSGSYGFSFRDPGSLRNPPFDIRVHEHFVNGTRTIEVVNATGVALVGKAQWNSIKYATLRKAPYTTGPLNIKPNEANDYIYCARLPDGRYVKFRLEYTTHPTLAVQRVQRFVYEIYKGI